MLKFAIINQTTGRKQVVAIATAVEENQALELYHRASGKPRCPQITAQTFVSLAFDPHRCVKLGK